MKSCEINRTSAEISMCDQIKRRIAYHANEHRQTYEVGKGVMDYLARDILADFNHAGGVFLPVKPIFLPHVFYPTMMIQYFPFWLYFSTIFRAKKELSVRTAQLFLKYVHSEAHIPKG